MVSLTQTTELFTAFISPEVLIEAIPKLDDQKKRALLQERAEAIVMRLILRVVHSAREDFAKKVYTRFDGNPGDSQCQVRAGCLFYIVQNLNAQMCKEMQSLSTKSGLPDDPSGKGMQGIAAQVNKMVCDGNTKKLDVVRKNFGELNISMPLCFLLKAYLSEALREVDHVNDQGKVFTRSEADRLHRLERAIMQPGYRPLRVAILTYNQETLSSLSAQFLEMLARNLSIPNTFHPRIVKRIEDQDVPTRTFTSLFHTTRATLHLLCQQQGTLCLLSIEPKKTLPIDPRRCQLQSDSCPSALYFQAPATPEEIYQPLASPPTGPMLVVDAVFNKAAGEISGALATYSLGTAILQQAAVSDPYEKGSTTETIADMAARAEVLAYQSRPPAAFDMHHYFVKRGCL